MSLRPRAPGRGLHSFACVTAAATFILVIAGGLVTSTGSGLAVPDWPLSYGMLMPPMVGGIFFEHGHRMVAGTIAILMLVLMIWLLRSETRRWVRRLGVVAFGTVILQALLGGLTVILLLPTLISATHATLAQTFFSLTVTLAIVTSPRWQRAPSPPIGGAPGIAGTAPESGAPGASITTRGAGATGGAGARRAPAAPGPEGLPEDGRAAGTGGTAGEARSKAWIRATLLLAAAAFAAVYIQLIIGAVMRHMDAGLAIPDFPLAFGRLIPPFWSREIAIHFAHRAWAVVVVACVTALIVAIRRDPARSHRGLTATLSVLLPVQVGLGAMTVLTRKDVAIATAHVATGAAILAACLTLAILLWRPVVEAAATRRRHGHSAGLGRS